MNTNIVLSEKDCSKNSCNCCGEAIYNSGGVIFNKNGVIAEYWSRWSPAHKGMFSLAITLDSRITDSLPTVYCISGKVTNEGLSYSLLDRIHTTWWNFDGICYQPSREEALASTDIDKIFEIAEIITVRDCRIALNIFEQLDLKYPAWVETMCDIYLSAYDLGLDFAATKPAIFPRTELKNLTPFLLNSDDNFFGINDENKMSLQFYKNKDGSITIDIPVPSEAGSYQKDTDLVEVKEILTSFSGEVKQVISAAQLQFVKW